MKKNGTTVDAGISRLVAAKNIRGFRTYASCQGHGFPVDRIKPYVAFTSLQSDAARLARMLRKDAESPVPQLLWGWEVTAGFNGVFRQCFRLHPTGPHYWWVRYCRRSLTKDFSSIVQMVKSANGEPACRGDYPGMPQSTNNQYGDYAS